MANESGQPFKPLKHVINYGGININGIANGVYLTIRPNSDISNHVVGTDGVVHTNIVVDNSATAELKMSYDNPTYKLMRLAAVAFQTFGVFVPFTSTNLDDLADTSFSANANIMRHSDDTYSQDVGDMFRTYSIYLHNVERV